MKQISIRHLSNSSWIIYSLIACISLVVGFFLATGNHMVIIVVFFFAGVVLLYMHMPEEFILLLMVINHEMFYLLPEDLLGGARYQGLLYLILPITGVVFIFLKNLECPNYFKFYILALMALTSISIIYAWFHGQPLIFGIKAAKSYFLILFFFVFISRRINIEKLFGYIVLTGVLLTFLNNIQYFFGLQLFHYTREMQRVGQVRFIVGTLFLVYALIIAFGEFLRSKKKWYLMASIYITLTVIFQGQTRMIMFGIFVMLIIMIYLMGFLDIKRIVFVGIPLFVVLIWLVPLIQATFFGDLYNLTRYEFKRRGGNIGIRLDTYDYYIDEIKKSPLIGRGIWNDEWRQYNPEDMKSQGLHISDIGMTSLIFHMGLAGAAWFFLLLIRVTKLCFVEKGKIRASVHPGIIGYFVYGIVTSLTLNPFTRPDAVIYLTLSLATLCHMNNSESWSSSVE